MLYNFFLPIQRTLSTRVQLGSRIIVSSKFQEVSKEILIRRSLVLKVMENVRVDDKL